MYYYKRTELVKLLKINTNCINNRILECLQTPDFIKVTDVHVKYNKLSIYVSGFVNGGRVMHFMYVSKKEENTRNISKKLLGDHLTYGSLIPGVVTHAKYLMTTFINERFENINK